MPGQERTVVENRAGGASGGAGKAVENGDVTVRFWGTRGSIPSPGPATNVHGGNTSCVEVCFGAGRRLILDAGSGLRALGQNLLAGEAELEATVFLTHFHWDHIQGFPFFRPIYRASTRLAVVGPEQDGIDVRGLFAGQMAPAYFPIPASALSAGLTFHGLAGGVWEGDGYVVMAMRVRHPSVTVAYRVEVGGRVITYAPDNELAGDDYPVGEGWTDEFDAFVRGSDLLIHDAMYTDEEYAARKGWGHSTFQQATELAMRAEVPHLVLFHHAPERTDDALSGLVEDTRQWVDSLGHGLRVGAAQEGVDISVGSAAGGQA